MAELWQERLNEQERIKLAKIASMKAKIKLLDRCIFAYLAFAPLVVPVIRGPFARWYAALTGSEYELVCGMMWLCGLISLAIIIASRVNTAMNLGYLEP